MDNSKIKSFVPDFQATMRYAEGIRKTVEWFDAEPSRQAIDAETDAAYDRLIEVYEAGLENARKAFEVAG